MIFVFDVKAPNAQRWRGDRRLVEWLGANELDAKHVFRAVIDVERARITVHEYATNDEGARYCVEGTNNPAKLDPRTVPLRAEFPTSLAAFAEHVVSPAVSTAEGATP